MYPDWEKEIKPNIKDALAETRTKLKRVIYINLVIQLIAILGATVIIALMLKE